MVKYITSRFNTYISSLMVFRCVNFISHTICSLESNLNKSFLRKVCMHLLINGNCFLDENRNIIDYDYVRIADNFEFRYENKTWKKKTVLHLKINDFYDFGTSPIEMCQKHIQIISDIEKFLKCTIQNGGKPSGFLCIPEFVTEEKRMKIKQSIAEVFTNMGQYGLAAILEGKHEWQKLGMTMSELQILEILEVANQSISLSFNIPSILLGLKDQTYNNYPVAHKQFIVTYITPLLKSIEQDLLSFDNDLQNK